MEGKKGLIQNTVCMCATGGSIPAL